MGSFLNAIISQMDRSTAGSEETARRVLGMCRNAAKNALFLGDDLLTPRLIAEKKGARVLATFGEECRAEKAAELGMDVRRVGAYELSETDGGWDLIWYNGLTEPDGIVRRLEQMHERLAEGGTAVYRTLCWLIEPSPDTRSYVDKRFGRPAALDEVLREAKAHEFSVEDFYIAPKSDWKQNFYKPMSELANRLKGVNTDRPADAADGIGEINKEIYMFDLHSEEYSFVYYILRSR